MKFQITNFECANPFRFTTSWVAYIDYCFKIQKFVYCYTFFY